MNANKAQEIINNIISEYRANNAKAARNQYPASKKYIARAEELGILHMIPNAPYSREIGNTEIQIILKAAEDAGHEVGGMVDGEGDVITTSASDLYRAINETTPKPTVELTEGNNEVTTSDDIVEVIRVQIDNGEAASFWIDEYELFNLAHDFSQEEIEAWEDGDNLTFTISQAEIDEAVKEARDFFEYAEAVEKEQTEQQLKNETIDWLNEVMTIPEIAQQYDVTEEAVRAAIRRGQLYARQSGATWLLLRGDIQARWSHKQINH